MKRVKLGAAVIVVTVLIYFIISYGLFFLYRSDTDIQLQEAPTVSLDRTHVVHKKVSPSQGAEIIEVLPEKSSITQKNSEPIDAVVIQKILDEVEPVDSDAVRDSVFGNSALGDYSFVTMPIPQDYTLDWDTQRVLDDLVCENFDNLLYFLTRSNNDVISQESCRSCAMHGILKKIRKKGALSRDEILVLQRLLANLYKFSQTIKSLGDGNSLTVRQELALKDLNTVQSVRKNLKLQSRKATTAAALEKLQSLDFFQKYN